MNTEVIERLRIESILTEDFCLQTDEHGNRWAACNGYVMEHATFCAMLMWSMANTMCYSSIMQQREDLIQGLKDINRWDTVLQGLSHNMVIKRIYQSFSKPLFGRDKTDIERRFLNLTDG